MPSETAAQLVAADAEYWAELSAKLPAGRDASDKVRRARMFSQFDPNGNGYLSLAEVDKGIYEVLGEHELFDSKKVTMRAFQAAKNSVKTKSTYGEDFVELCEFRLLLLYLRQYFELYVMFGSIDTSGDNRLELSEFKAALPQLKIWAPGVDFSDPEAVFKEIDIDGGDGGYVRFDEFAQWALEKHLDLEGDNETEEVPIPKRNLASDNVAAHLASKSPARRPASASARSPHTPKRKAAARPATATSARASPVSAAPRHSSPISAGGGRKPPVPRVATLHSGQTGRSVHEAGDGPRALSTQQADAALQKMKGAPSFSFGRGSSRSSPSGTWAFQRVQSVPKSLPYSSGRNTGAAQGVASLAGIEAVPVQGVAPTNARPMPAAGTETARSTTARTASSRQSARPVALPR